MRVRRQRSRLKDGLGGFEAGLVSGLRDTAELLGLETVQMLSILLHRWAGLYDLLDQS